MYDRYLAAVDGNFYEQSGEYQKELNWAYIRINKQANNMMSNLASQKEIWRLE